MVFPLSRPALATFTPLDHLEYQSLVQKLVDVSLFVAVPCASRHAIGGMLADAASSG